jgi:hypothetical protein
MLRRTKPRDAIRSGAVAINGSMEDFERAIDLLAWVPREGRAH